MNLQYYNYIKIKAPFFKINQQAAPIDKTKAKVEKINRSVAPMGMKAELEDVELNPVVEMEDFTNVTDQHCLTLRRKIIGE